MKQTTIVSLILLVSIIVSQTPISTATVQPAQNVTATIINSTFSINYTWDFTNTPHEVNYSHNNIWSNNTTDLSIEHIVGAHGWSNLTIAGYNFDCGGLSTFESIQTQIPNQPISISNVPDVIVAAGQSISVDFDFIDADYDVGIFSTNRTDKFSQFNTTTGIGNWETIQSDSGSYSIDFGVSDGWGSISNYTMNIIVNRVSQTGSWSSTPPPPQYRSNAINTNEINVDESHIDESMAEISFIDLLYEQLIKLFKNIFE